MVATVLLIAFTVAIGGIINLWLTGFTTTTTSSVETAATNVTKCAGTYLDVIAVTNTSILITNPGPETISNPVCYSTNGTLIDTLGTTLAVGTINSTTWVRGNSTSVICSGTCLNIGVTGECKQGQSCWKTP